MSARRTYVSARDAKRLAALAKAVGGSTDRIVFHPDGRVEFGAAKAGERDGEADLAEWERDAFGRGA